MMILKGIEEQRFGGFSDIGLNAIRLKAEFW
jgi:hypothetical protein